jgi:hypothetical protein
MGSVWYDWDPMLDAVVALRKKMGQTAYATAEHGEVEEVLVHAASQPAH